MKIDLTKKKSLKYAELPLEKTILLDAKHSEKLSETGKYSLLASTSSQELKPFKKIYGFIVANGDTLFMNQTLESRLTIDFIDQLEIQVGFQLINVRDHKKIFDT